MGNITDCVNQPTHRPTQGKNHQAHGPTKIQQQPSPAQRAEEDKENIAPSNLPREDKELEKETTVTCATSRLKAGSNSSGRPNSQEVGSSLLVDEGYGRTQARKHRFSVDCVPGIQGEEQELGLCPADIKKRKGSMMEASRTYSFYPSELKQHLQSIKRL